MNTRQKNVLYYWVVDLVYMLSPQISNNTSYFGNCKNTYIIKCTIYIWIFERVVLLGINQD